MSSRDIPIRVSKGGMYMKATVAKMTVVNQITHILAGCSRLDLTRKESLCQHE